MLEEFGGRCWKSLEEGAGKRAGLVSVMPQSMSVP